MGVFRLRARGEPGSLETMPFAVNPIHPPPVDGRVARLLGALWPPCCLACGERGEGARDLCRACADALPWLGIACPSCALPLPLPGPAVACGGCLQHPPPLVQVQAAFVYARPLDRLLPQLKFHGDLAAGRLLSQLMAQACAGAPRPDALVPIPLHATRLRRRGYDQALELARPLARQFGLPLRSELLRRCKATAPQSEQASATDRQRNLRDAFQVPAGVSLPAHVALVDDVMTTGATLHAAAKALRRAGVPRVDAWVCARVP
jgi:ComF family protein